MCEGNFGWSFFIVIKFILKYFLLFSKEKIRIEGKNIFLSLNIIIVSFYSLWLYTLDSIKLVNDYKILILTFILFICSTFEWAVGGENFGVIRINFDGI